MKLPDLTLTDEGVAELSAALGGCDFAGLVQREFLERFDDCDVQAAPGSGKTTLLVAKLDLLARRWQRPRSGVCVLSHTNAAGYEVEHRLRDRDAAAKLLSYPHFIGTITTFIHRFLAMPYLRALALSLRRVDDAYCDALAFSTIKEPQFQSLRNWRSVLRGNQRDHQFDQVIRSLRFGRDLEPVWKSGQGIPGPTSQTGKALVALKNRLRDEGVFRFEDMTAFAWRALDVCPELAARLCDRFPIVFLDEAQDTGSEHRELLERVFRGGSVLQVLGDANQAIYDHDRNAEPGDAWTADPARKIDLGRSRRFGESIAAFASRLGWREPQEIEGAGEVVGGNTVFLYSDETVTNVIPAFARLVIDRCERAFEPDFRSWVIASGIRGAKDSLRDYWASYCPPHVSSAIGSMVGELREVRDRCREGLALHDQMLRLAAAMVELLRRQGIPPLGPGGRWTPGRVWRDLDDRLPGVSRRLRRVIRDCLVAEALDDANWWNTHRQVLGQTVVSLGDGARLTQQAEAFLAYAAKTVDGGGSHPVGGNRFRYLHADRALTIALGSIHSVKGQTHDATMIVQSKAKRCFDLRSALPIVFAEKAVPMDKPDVCKAVTNVFVGATRPRSLLALALPEKDFPKKMRQGAEKASWSVVELETD